MSDLHQKIPQVLKQKIIKNIPTGGPANSVNYSLEICYFDAE